MPNVYEIMTDRIVALLKQGTVPWHKPWVTSRPRNLVSDKAYRGLNVFMLGTQPYATPYWLTFRQAQERGGTVRKGEKSTPIVFWKVLDAKQEAETPDPQKRGFCLRYYSVFNAEQCDGLAVPAIDMPNVAEPLEAADAILRQLPENIPQIDFIGQRACYIPAKDVVQMPKREAFHSSEKFYATLFHELVHGTGHATRLARPGIVDPSFLGSHEYSREELIAEMGAAFLCAECGIENAIVDNSAAYLAHWIEALQADSRAVVLAAGAAQKAADWLLNRTVVADSPVTPETEPNEGGQVGY